jgi:hypothetical protein
VGTARLRPRPPLITPDQSPSYFDDSTYLYLIFTGWYSPAQILSRWTARPAGAWSPAPADQTPGSLGTTAGIAAVLAEVSHPIFGLSANSSTRTDQSFSISAWIHLDAIPTSGVQTFVSQDGTYRSSLFLEELKGEPLERHREIRRIAARYIGNLPGRLHNCQSSILWVGAHPVRRTGLREGDPVRGARGLRPSSRP